LDKKWQFCTFVFLKRIAAIFFLSIYLISVTELNQLVKFPVLIEHFMEHREKNHKLTLLDFLDMHYSQQHEMDADHDRDMQLPFKSHDGFSFAFMSVFVNGAANQISTKMHAPTTCHYSDYTDAFLSPVHLSSIWQPPKSC
jgi:hypothetical protein